MRSPASLRWSRRSLCIAAAAAPFVGARAQSPVAAPKPAAPGPSANRAPFGFPDVLEAARRLVQAPYSAPASPKGAHLSYDDYRDVRFREAAAFLNFPGSKFRLELFPLGGVGTTQVRVNLVSRGAPQEIPFSPDLFDFGPLVSQAQRATVTGFAGLRLHYPLNKPTYFDEVIVFLRASYFRFLGRGQIYGQSMRGLAIGAGDLNEPEEFPVFREFWVFEPEREANSIQLMALLDSPSLAGAFRFVINPGRDTTIEASARIYARTEVGRLGLAPITSMYFTGESGPRLTDPFRLEVHDSSGLLMRSAEDSWTWRPLRNPARPRRARFTQASAGYGLTQRLRAFDLYEDLEANYQLRPSYWIEPASGFDNGELELVELPEAAETDDNIVAQWMSGARLKPGEGLSWSCRMSTRNRDPDTGRVAIARHTLIARPGPDMTDAPPGAHRFFVDFAGEALAPFLADPSPLAVLAQAPNATIKTSIARNPERPELRVTLDVVVAKGTSTTASVRLAWLGHDISETWTMPVEG